MSDKQMKSVTMVFTRRSFKNEVDQDLERKMYYFKVFIDILVYHGLIPNTRSCFGMEQSVNKTK